MTKEMYDMERITKQEFKEEARKGVYFFNSIWTSDATPLETLARYISKIDVQKYMVEKELRVLQNNSGNLRFKRIDNTYTYLDMVGKDTTVHKIGSFLVVYTKYTNQMSDKDCIVMYIKKDAINEKDVQIDPELFIKELPSGSGIDCDWEYVEHKNGKVTFKNWYHVMNKHGYYDGYMPFQFTVFFDPVKNQFDFNRLVCNENTRKSFSGLHEYLEDTIYATIVGNIDVDKHLKK